MNLPVLNPQGPVALAELHVMIITVLLCAIVVIPVFFLLFYFAWKYRADSPHAATYHTPDWDHDNHMAEFSWWLVPTIIIIILSVVSWQSTHALDPYKPLTGQAPVSNTPAITVDVVALDWKWLFIYPDEGIATVNQVAFPAGTPVHFYLTADAPMNSFWIPSLGGQIMVMPGMTTQLNLMANATGTFTGVSGNISGQGFSGMTFTAQSVSENDFIAWLARARAASSTLDSISYKALAAPSSYVPVSYYSSVQNGLFDSIVAGYMATSSTDHAGMMNMQMP